VGSSAGVALAPVGAFEEMIIGSPEFRAEARARLATPPRWPVIWWMAFGASVLAGAFFIGWAVALLVDVPSSADAKLFAVSGFFLAFGHVALVPATLTISRLRACASSPSIRSRWLGVGIALAVLLLAVDASAAWMVWRHS